MLIAALTLLDINRINRTTTKQGAISKINMEVDTNNRNKCIIITNKITLNNNTEILVELTNISRINMEIMILKIISSSLK